MVLFLGVGGGAGQVTGGRIESLQQMALLPPSPMSALHTVRILLVFTRPPAPIWGDKVFVCE